MLSCCLQVTLQGSAHRQGTRPTADARCTVSPTQATHLSDAVSSVHPSQLQLGPGSVSAPSLSVAATPQRGTQVQNAATQQAAAGLLPAQTRAETGLPADADALWPSALQGAPLGEGPGSPLYAGGNGLAEYTGRSMCTSQAGQQGSSRLPNGRGRALSPGGGATPLQAAGGHCSEASPASSFADGRQSAPLAGDLQGVPAAAAGCLQQHVSRCQASPEHPEHGEEMSQAAGQAGADRESPEGVRSSCGDGRSAGVAGACNSQQQGKQPQAGLTTLSPATAGPVSSEGASSPSSCKGLTVCRPLSPLGTSDDVARGLQAVHECLGADSGSSEPQQLAPGCGGAAAGRWLEAPVLSCTRPGDERLQPLQTGSVVPGRAGPGQPPPAAAVASAEQPAASSLAAKPASGGPAAQGMAAAAEARTLWEPEEGLCAAAGRPGLRQVAETEKEPCAAAVGLSLQQAAAPEPSSSKVTGSGGGRPVHCSRLPGSTPHMAAESAAPTPSEQGPEGGVHGEIATLNAVDRQTVLAPAGGLPQQSACGPVDMRGMSISSPRKFEQLKLRAPTKRMLISCLHACSMPDCSAPMV